MGGGGTYSSLDGGVPTLRSGGGLARSSYGEGGTLALGEGVPWPGGTLARGEGVPWPGGGGGVPR